MKFGSFSIDEVLGGVLAHTLRADGVVLKKGIILGSSEVALLKRAGIVQVTAALWESGDVGEDEAAGRIAEAVRGVGVRIDPAFTGRANLFAEEAGVLVVDRASIDTLNCIDEAITFATLQAFAHVEAGEMIATVKIIPYAAPAEAVARAAATGPLVRVAPFVRRKVAVISTLLPGLADKVVEKTLRVTSERLAPAGATIVSDDRVPHEAGPLCKAIAGAAGVADLLLVFGASAIADRRDVIPAALGRAGGKVEHLGMPVDPGNLLMVGRLGAMPVLGAPGCARSPKENGFDWVLMRLLAGLPVLKADITAMGVGGLLMEIVSRPQPREREPAPTGALKVAALVLAAGRSTRMGGPNKLLATLDGVSLIRRATEAALGAGIRKVVVVTGHQAEAVRAALAGLPVRFAHNADFAEGLSTSLRTGVEALPEDVDAALVLLGDMPRVSSALVDSLIAAFNPVRGHHIVVPVVEGRRGNPVLWSRRFFGELRKVTGDQGGRAIIVASPEAVAEVHMDDDGAHLDLDTSEAMAAAGARLAG